MLRNLTMMALLCGGLIACDEVTVSNVPVEPTTRTPIAAASPNAKQSLRSFAVVTQRMEPIIERECATRTKNVDCDFKIVVDDRPDQPPNAYQTIDRNGRPIIAFTTGLIEMASNADELAFVLGHEGAHHILGHIARQRDNAITGAVIFAGLATLSGASPSDVQSAQKLGAQVGARSYSKDFELEADELGTIITARSGYNPLRGSAFFTRIPDPGDKFLGTHPPNAKRVEIVRKTAANL